MYFTYFTLAPFQYSSTPTFTLDTAVEASDLLSQLQPLIKDNPCVDIYSLNYYLNYMQ